MGIADATSYAKAFPPGALFLQANLTVNGDSFTIRGANQEVVTFTAGYAGLFAANMDVIVPVPCGDGVISVTIRFDVRAHAPLDESPIAVITTPPVVTCPTTLILKSVAVDPDGDLDHARWYIDDILMAAGVTSIAMTTDHELRLVAYDARGGATTTTKSVACH